MLSREKNLDVIIVKTKHTGANEIDTKTLWKNLFTLKVNIKLPTYIVGCQGVFQLGGLVLGSPC